MPIVSAKCPNCGGSLQVDNGKEAGICNFCGNAFIVEKAIHNYNTYTTNNFTADVINYHGTNPQSILTRIKLFLEDGAFENAKSYCEKLLDIEPENAWGYICSLMADMKIKNIQQLATQNVILNRIGHFNKALRFAEPTFKKELEAINNQNLEHHYQIFLQKMKKASTEEELIKVSNLFLSIAYYNDSKYQSEKCIEKINKIKEIDRKIWFLEGEIEEQKAIVSSKKKVTILLCLFTIILPIIAISIYNSIDLTDSNNKTNFSIVTTFLLATSMLLGLILTYYIEDKTTPYTKIRMAGVCTLGLFFILYAIYLLIFSIIPGYFEKERIEDLVRQIIELEQMKNEQYKTP